MKPPFVAYSPNNVMLLRPVMENCEITYVFIQDSPFTNLKNKKLLINMMKVVFIKQYIARSLNIEVFILKKSSGSVNQN